MAVATMVGFQTLAVEPLSESDFNFETAPENPTIPLSMTPLKVDNSADLEAIPSTSNPEPTPFTFSGFDNSGVDDSVMENSNLGLTQEEPTLESFSNSDFGSKDDLGFGDGDFGSSSTSFGDESDIPMFGQSLDVVVMDKENIDIGLLVHPDNMALHQSITLKRGHRSPDYVNLIFNFYSLKKDQCIRYEVDRTDLQDVSKETCTPNQDGSFNCGKTVSSNLYNAKTKCAEKGLVRVLNRGKVRLDFDQAIRLTKTGRETFRVFIRQKSPFKNSFITDGAVVESPSQYYVNNRRGVVRFREKNTGYYFNIRF